jgi:hypothetical protein
MTKEGTDSWVFRKGDSFGVLKPCERKLSRTVFRGVGSRKAPLLPGIDKRGPYKCFFEAETEI